MMPKPRTALLVIRGWVEEGSTEPLRAQMRVTDDVGHGIEQAVTLSQPDAVRALVNEWLDRLLDEDASETHP